MIPLADDNPTRSTPVITYIFIASCVAIFLWQLSLGPNVKVAIYALGVIPASLLQGALLPTELRWVSPEMTVVTSMFLHGGFMHLIGNMLYLWVFGDNIEDISSIKYLAPRIYSSQYRAVTASDYSGIIPFVYPNVESVTAYGGEELEPPEYGKVFISIKPRNGSFLSQITKDDISRQLKQYSIAGIKPEIIDLKYLYVEVDTSVYYNTNSVSDTTELITSVTKALTTYSKSSDINDFGGRFKYSKVLGLVDASARGVTSNITRVKMRRDITPELNTFATYELCYGNAFYDQPNGYGIRSTGFTVNGIDGTLYLGDIPTAGTAFGKLVFFKLVNNLPLIVKNDAGTVDYVHGEINLDVVNISGTSLTSGEIQVEAIPDSNDVIALKDLYLQLDVTNSTVNALPDVVSSGENTSATAYVTTSSYASESIYTR